MLPSWLKIAESIDWPQVIRVSPIGPGLVACCRTTLDDPLYGRTRIPAAAHRHAAVATSPDPPDATPLTSSAH